MRVYNLSGYSLLLLHAFLSASLAPRALGPWWGLLVGVTYFLVVWFCGGVYLSNVIHMGIAHRALDFRPWFINALVVGYNLTAIYINPVSWVNRHRHHHAFADRDGDPNKRSEDGFWKTLWLCCFPYRCRFDFARDSIFKSWSFRIVSRPWFAVLAQFSSYALLWWIVRSWSYALVLWCSVRAFGLWTAMVQNYWSHDRRFGSRRYDDADNHAMNIGDWLPVTITFSACLQNNHHHYPHLFRLSHHIHEYDFGLLTLRGMKALGLVKASPTGTHLPADLELTSLGL